MSSQKIGPNSLASRARFCTGALESSDSMLPTTGLVGGCGIGLSRLLDAIARVSPAYSVFYNPTPSQLVVASELTHGRHSGMVPKDQTRNLEIPGSVLRIAPE
jgi:hypothetical protein